MNKKVIVVAAVALLLAAGSGYAIMNKDDSSTSNNQSTNLAGQTSQANDDSSQLSEGSFASITGGGKATKCDIDYSSNEGQGSGTIYTDGKGRGRMSVNFSGADNSGSGEVNTLYTSDKAYVWFKGDDSGSDDTGTMGFVYDKAAYASTPTSSSSTTTPDQKFKTDCQNWNVDESLLSPPSDVNFTSFPASQ